MPTIKKLRALLNLSQSKMGKLLGMSFQRVSELERGTRTETKQMQAHLEAVKIVDESGKVDELMERCEKIGKGEK